MEKTDAPDVLPVILGGDIGAYSLARAFHEAYGIVPLVLSQADCHLCGDSSILANRVVPHLERREVLLAALTETAECFADRTLLLLGCGDWYVRLIVEMRAQLEGAFIIPYIDEDLLNRLTDKDRFYELCASTGVPTPRTVVVDLADPQFDPAALPCPSPFPSWPSPPPRRPTTMPTSPKSRRCSSCTMGQSSRPRSRQFAAVPMGASSSSRR